MTPDKRHHIVKSKYDRGKKTLQFDFFTAPLQPNTNEKLVPTRLTFNIQSASLVSRQTAVVTCQHRIQIAKKMQTADYVQNADRDYRLRIKCTLDRKFV